MRKPLTIRDLRLHWPEAERRLLREGELVLTRDGRPIAKISAYREEKPTRQRWSADQHRKWLNRTWKGTASPATTDDLLAQDRGA